MSSRSEPGKRRRGKTKKGWQDHAHSRRRPLTHFRRHQPSRTTGKSAKGIEGLDEIALGGLPRGRPRLICGTAGCGKSLMGMELLVRGAMEFDEPGVLMTFEETAEDITKNVASLGYDLTEMTRKKRLAIDFVRVERREIEVVPE